MVKKGNRLVKRVKLLFWNIAGLWRQDLDFWKYLSGYDYIGLCETWVEEESWNKIKKDLLDSHVWFHMPAVKDKGRGRAKGGIIVGVKKVWRGVEWETIKTNVEGILHIRVKDKEEMFNIFIIYNGVYGKEIGDILMKVTEDFV